MGGMGKTSLAAQCVRDLVADADSDQVVRYEFDVVLWRSLRNAPPLAELLPPLLQILSDQQLPSGQQLRAGPANIDDQLHRFLGYLRAKRILLVLDNVERILQPERAGAYRPGYEPYEQLIQQMATYNHQSHLLLISRERLRGYDRLARDSQLIQSLQLGGLDADAGQALLAQRGLHDAGNAASMLIARYSGNPLALKLVADTVDEFFDGDIAEFLADESLVFDDMRAVLDQQFARLSPLEQEILFWLAIEREPISLQTLNQNLLQAPPRRNLLEALRDLQRRALIEHPAAWFRPDQHSD